MVQFSATRCSCIAILWVSLVSFAAITLRVASQRVFIVAVYFVIDSVRELLDTLSYATLQFRGRTNCAYSRRKHLENKSIRTNENYILLQIHNSAPMLAFMYVPTNSTVQDLHRKVGSCSAGQEIPYLYGSRRIIVVNTKARNSSRLWTISIQSTVSDPLCLRRVSISPPWGLFPKFCTLSPIPRAF
jgi:hypothetical protein